jgi:hypothetical protein
MKEDEAEKKLIFTKQGARLGLLSYIALILLVALIFFYG